MEWKDSTLVRSVVVGGIAVVLSYGIYRRWVRGNVCSSKAMLTGKVAIVTGANSGIGLETAVGLAKRGARVILACRSEKNGAEAEKLVKLRSKNDNIEFVRLDLSSLESVRQFARKIIQSENQLDILVNNAGVALTSYRKTQDGFEMHLGVNHLGHFLLTNLLVDLMRLSPDISRVINVSSSLYKRSSEFDFGQMNSDDLSRYHPRMPGKAYSQSKLANILFTRSLSRRLDGSSICSYAVFPGLVVLWLAFYFMVKTPWQGSQTILHCAVSEELEGVSGLVYANCQEKQLETAVASSDEVAEELWRISAEMVDLES